jgi:hypothetical protein
MNIETVQVFKGTTPTLTFDILTEDGSTISLVGASVTLLSKLKYADTSYFINKECNIIDPVNGICNVTFGSTDLSTVGDYISNLRYQKDAVVLLVGEFVLKIKDVL